ncbi:MAG: ferredoxin family protein [Candidatus Hydrogenedentes bacterium]|nr:ferredoxin family protein [Candidatus Hydrogenedentota bacterium]
MRTQASKTDGLNLRVVFHGEGLAPEMRAETLCALLEAGFEVSRPMHGEAHDAAGSPMLVLGPAPDTLAASEGVQYHDIAGQTPEAVVDLARTVRKASGARALEAWKPWFPVIDYDRCTNCMQCLSFCLFDVYAVDEHDKISVQNESNCKTDCPACSRVCPEVAILFPKYRKGPINGDVVRPEDVQREAMKVDVSALLGGDIYSALRSRQSDARKRFSTERDESKALLERKRCLKKLKKDLDIPEEVLMSLPSAGDIEERAERAREKLKKRLERSKSARDAERPAPTQEDWGI